MKRWRFRLSSNIEFLSEPRSYPQPDRFHTPRYMHRSFPSVFRLLLFFGASMTLCAQQSESRDVLFGPRLELAGGFDAASIPIFGGFPDCGSFESGSALSVSAGGTILLPTLFSS